MQILAFNSIGAIFLRTEAEHGQRERPHPLTAIIIIVLALIVYFVLPSPSEGQSKKARMSNDPENESRSGSLPQSSNEPLKKHNKSRQ